MSSYSNLQDDDDDRVHQQGPPLYHIQQYQPAKPIENPHQQEYNPSHQPHVVGYASANPPPPAFHEQHHFPTVEHGPLIGSHGYSDDHHEVPLNDEHYNGEKFPAQPEYRDLGWAIFYVVHLLIFFIAGMAMYGKNKDAITDGSSTHDENGMDTENDEAHIELDADFFRLLFLLIFVGSAMAYGWILVVKNYAKQLIQFTLYLSAGMSLFFAMVLFSTGGAVAGIVFFLIFLLNVLYIYWIRSRIPFAAAILSIVSSFVREYPATFYYAFAAMLVHFVWMIVWSISAASMIYSVQNTENNEDLEGLVYIFVLLSFFWTVQVVKNVVHTTTCGALGTWYFVRPHEMPENPTTQSLKRALTTSFGSICLGSLMVAVLRTMRALLHNARKARNDFARACAECLIQALENLVEYFNRYAFTYVAVYGQKYTEAASSVWGLLKSTGFMVIINDDLIEGVLVFGALLGGFALAAFGGLVSHYALGMTSWGLYAGLGFLIGFSIFAIVTEVVDSSVAALTVCFCEDPQALSNSHPNEHRQLSAALYSRYPQVKRGSRV